MTDDELWTVTPIPRADVTGHWPNKAEAQRMAEAGPRPTYVRGPAYPGLAALVPDPLRRRTLLDRLCWWRR